jgi:hypothetical protein
VTRLRKMMLEELQRRNYSESTTRYYINSGATFGWESERVIKKSRFILFDSQWTVDKAW